LYKHKKIKSDFNIQVGIFHHAFNAQMLLQLTRDDDFDFKSPIKKKTAQKLLAKCDAIVFGLKT
jgi:hypothetical protein